MAPQKGSNKKKGSFVIHFRVCRWMKEDSSGAKLIATISAIGFRKRKINAWTDYAFKFKFTSFSRTFLSMLLFVT